jgi:hypothetical protein
MTGTCRCALLFVSWDRVSGTFCLGAWNHDPPNLSLPCNWY